MKRLKMEESEMENDSRSLISISSSDDEEANMDMSLAIVERARERRKGKLMEIIDEPVSSEDIDAVKKSKKWKSKEEKKKTEEEKGDVEEKENADVDGHLNEGGPLGITNTVVTEENGAADNLILKKLLRGRRYFDRGDTNLEACFKCGEDGHTAVNCPERREKPCYVCGMFGHNAKQCTQGQDCFICKRRGHIAKNCPDKHAHTAQDSVICVRCGDLGHDMLSCNNNYAPDDLKGVQCYICKNYGHLCCIDFIVDSGREVSCYNCAQSGHNGQGCAKSRGSINSSASPSLCYNCGEKGHFARGCTKNVQGGKPRGDTDGYASPSLCYKCNEEGHFARDCTKDAKFDRWEGGSTPRRFNNKNRDSGGFRAHKKRNTQYKDPWKKSGSSRRRGGWITDDSGDLPKRKHRARGWKSTSTPGRTHKVKSSDSVENCSSSQSSFKKNNLFTGSPSNHYGYDSSRFHKSRGHFEGT